MWGKTLQRFLKKQVLGKPSPQQHMSALQSTPSPVHFRERAQAITDLSFPLGNPRTPPPSLCLDWPSGCPLAPLLPEEEVGRAGVCPRLEQARRASVHCQ